VPKDAEGDKRTA